LALQKGRLNAHLEFSQSTKNSGYFWFVFNLLSPIIQTKPYFNTSVRKGTQCFSYILRTPSLPFLTVLKSLFYINGIKCIPECIFDLLTPIALAHWIMGDGYWDGAGTVLCTDSFTLPEVVRLMNVLIIRYRLDCAIRMHRGQPLICIRARSIPLLRSIVLPYMCSSMLSKLGL